MYTYICMLFFSIAQHYLVWHYTRALREILHVWRNFFWFTLNFFSMSQLLGSLLSPFKRMTEPKGEGFSFEDLASFIIINLISRLIGFTLRLGIIILGVLSLALLTILIVVTYIFWLLAPALIITCVYYAIMFLIN